MTKHTSALRQRESGTGAVLKSLAALPLAAAAGWAVYSHLLIDHEVVLPDAVPAERKVFQSLSAGRLSYYHSSAPSGRPLVLLHSVNAAASAFEMRPLFLPYRDRRPVYALDLPGYGFSERANRKYTIRLFEDSIIDFLRTQVGEPADVVALSLGGEFAAWAALAEPGLFASLTIISPTGFRYSQNVSGPQQVRKNSMSGVLHELFSVPIWALPFFDLLATRASIEKFLQKSFTGSVPQDMIDYAYATAHQPGAQHVPLHFISGKLFTPSVRETVYEQLNIPTLVLYDRDPYTTFDLLPQTLAVNPRWQAVRIVPSLGLPHFEQLDSTIEALEQFWQGL